MRGAKILTGMVAATLVLAVAACGGEKQGVEYNYPTKNRGDTAPRFGDEKKETIFGPEGLLGGDSKNKGPATGIGVNSFLWRASLDTVGFMPIASADPFGGTILTEWYQLPESPDERVKMTVFILDRALRADGVKVTVFKQVPDKKGGWTDVPVDPSLSTSVEDSILTRARELRIKTQE